MTTVAPSGSRLHPNIRPHGGSSMPARFDHCFMGDQEQTCEPVDISFPVAYVQQPTDMSCWAASLAMITGRGTAEEVAKEVNLEHAMQDGASTEEFQTAAAALGLQLEGGACGYPNMFAGWLQSYG